MSTIDLPAGSLKYRVGGPEDASRPPVVFVHGFLVDGTLWSGVAADLAKEGVRSYAPDWPLGSHTIALQEDADQTPRGVARRVIDFLEALDLEDVTLVGNDTGGAICQFVLDTDASRVGRVVLTNCDAFDQFPPPPFDRMFKMGRRQWVLNAAMKPMVIKRLRHSSQGYGALVAKPLDPAQTRKWVEPCLHDAGIRRDTSRFLRAVDPQELLAVSNRLGAFDAPALLVWGGADPFFKVDFARRLQEQFKDARLVEVPGGRTFIPLDEPARVADEIASFVSV